MNTTVLSVQKTEVLILIYLAVNRIAGFLAIVENRTKINFERYESGVKKYARMENRNKVMVNNLIYEAEQKIIRLRI